MEFCAFPACRCVILVFTKCRQQAPNERPQIAGVGDYFLKGLKASPTHGWGEKPLLFIQ